MTVTLIRLINARSSMSQPWLQGDYIQKGSDKRKVLGVCGECVIVSNVILQEDDRLRSCFPETQYELEEDGWSLFPSDTHDIAFPHAPSMKARCWCAETPKEESWPKLGDSYWYIHSNGVTYSSAFMNGSFDKACTSWGNCHRSEADALAWRERVKAIKNPKT